MHAFQDSRPLGEGAEATAAARLRSPERQDDQ
jgi:hypothetical protein